MWPQDVTLANKIEILGRLCGRRFVRLMRSQLHSNLPAHSWHIASCQLAGHSGWSSRPLECQALYDRHSLRPSNCCRKLRSSNGPSGPQDDMPTTTTTVWLLSSRRRQQRLLWAINSTSVNADVYATVNNYPLTSAISRFSPANSRYTAIVPRDKGVRAKRRTKELGSTHYSNIFSYVRDANC